MSAPRLFVVADPAPRIVEHEDSPPERISNLTGLFGPIRALASENDADVLCAARTLVARLASQGLTTRDLAEKVGADPKIVWFPVAKLPRRREARRQST